MIDDLVLIAEDDVDIRDMLGLALSSAGYRTIGAMDGQTAADIATVAQPVAIITDVRMPALDGMELCQRIRRDPRTRDTPIVMISALGQAQHIEAELAAGADDYLPKPLSPRRLVARLQHLIDAQRRQPAC